MENITITAPTRTGPRGEDLVIQFANLTENVQNRLAAAYAEVVHATSSTHDLRMVHSQRMCRIYHMIPAEVEIEHLDADLECHGGRVTGPDWSARIGYQDSATEPKHTVIWLNVEDSTVEIWFPVDLQ